MQKVFVDSNVQSQQVGSLFEPVRRQFSGIGAAIVAALKALPTSQTLVIIRNSSTEYSVGSISADPITSAFAEAVLVDKATTIRSSLPDGATVRYSWVSDADGTGAELIPLAGTNASGVYSLEDFLNGLFDGIFDTNFGTSASLDLTIATAENIAVVVDQNSGLIYLSESANNLPILTGHMPGGVPSVVFKTESQKWE